jgi:hypothetical protein
MTLIDPGYRNQVGLANYVGAVNPPSYYWEPETLACGHSEEDCDGIVCGLVAVAPPEDYDDWLGLNWHQMDVVSGR